jgi:hypothetical protein
MERDAGTSAMIDIHPGDILLDNNPRARGRMVRIDTVGDYFADGTTIGSNRHATIRLTSVYVDGKPRVTGYMLLKRAKK